MKKTISITLDVEVKAVNPLLDAIDDMLDAGAIQDSIREFAADRGIRFETTSATCDEVRSKPRKERAS